MQRRPSLLREEVQHWYGKGGEKLRASEIAYRWQCRGLHGAASALRGKERKREDLAGDKEKGRGGAS